MIDSIQFIFRIGNFRQSPHRRMRSDTSQNYSNLITIHWDNKCCLILVLLHFLSTHIKQQQQYQQSSNSIGCNLTNNMCKNENITQIFWPAGNTTRTFHLTGQFSLINYTITQAADLYYIYKLKHKVHNKFVKVYNGNTKVTIKTIHWNIGNRFWKHKINDIEHTINEFNPDLFLISEANLFSQDQDYEIHIDGYKMIHPKTILSLGYSRLILLVKEGINVQLIADLMDDTISSIWTKINKNGAKNLYLGGVYREHRHLLQPSPNLTGGEINQNKRWRLLVNQWKRANTKGDVIVLGDTNIDTQVV